MRLYLMLLAIILIAVSCAVYIGQTPALILIELGDYTLAGSLWLLLLLFGIFGFGIYLIWHFIFYVLRLPSTLHLFFFGTRASRIDEHFKELMVASIIENPYASRQHLLALTKLKSHPGLCALKTALLAIDHGQIAEYELSLEQAKQDPEVELWMIEWVKLRAMLVQETAQNLIEDKIRLLKKERKAESAIWPLELRYAQSIRNWKRASDAVYRLKSLKLLTSDQFKVLILECDVHELEDAPNLNALNLLWNEHSRGRKKEPAMIKAFKDRYATLTDAAVMKYPG